MADTSALTGESVPRKIEVGDDILSGFINNTGLLVVKVTKEYGESTVAKILDLVRNASSRKAPTEQFITKFARYYTPVVVAIAALLAILPPVILPGASFSGWLYRALVFLVISCPCALVVSIPLSFFGGIGGASKSGILIKGGNYLEALHNVDSVIFDKTGTLTKGVFKVTSINPASGFTSAQVLEYAALAESFSTHPIAKSILEAYKSEQKTGKINSSNDDYAIGTSNENDKINSYEEEAGYGVKVVTGGKTILAGSIKLMEKAGISLETEKPHNPELSGTIVHVAVEGQYAGRLAISDEIKEDSVEAIKGLKELGIRKLVMLTGDSKKAAEGIARMLKIDEFI
jgi:Cd2+/Zn2+-exporting ATPase